MEGFNYLLESVQKEIAIHKNEYENLKAQFVSLIKYNKSINNQLKESINKRIADEITIKSLTQQLENLSELQSLMKDKILPFKDGTNAVHDVYILRQNYEKKIEDTINYYQKAIEHCSNDLFQVKNEVDDLKRDKIVLNNQLATYENDLKKAIEEVKLKENLLKNQALDIENSRQKLVSMEALVLENEKLLKDIKKENIDFKINNRELHEQNTDLKKKIAELENKFSTIEQKAKKDSLDSQNAMLEFKALAFNNKLAKTYEENLKSSIKQQIEHATQKYKQDAKNTKKEYDERILCLEQEIHNLQSESSRKQFQFEKCVREKESLELKMKTIKESENMFVSNMTFDDIHKKLSQSERSRDEALLRIQSLENSLHDHQKTMTKDLQYLTDESRAFKLQLEVERKQLNDALKERLLMSNQVRELKNKCAILEKQLLLEESQKEQIQYLKAKLVKQKHSMDQQQQKAKEKYNKDLSEVREVVDYHYLINNKWKKALEELTSQSESKIKILLQDMLLVTQQRDQLQYLLQSKQ